MWQRDQTGALVLVASGAPSHAAVIASAARGSVATDASGTRRHENWQDAAFGYYDSLGEIHEAAQFAARPLSKLVLKVEQQDPVTGEWADSKDEKATGLLGRLKGPNGDRSGLLNAYGQLMFLAGESYLVGSIEDENEAWEFLSTAELKPVQGEAGAYRRYKFPGAVPVELQEASDDDFEPLPNEIVVYRFWRPHPRFSLMADSAMRGVLDICEELVVLTRSVRGEALSRLANAGLLLIPEEATMPSLEAGPDEDPEDDPLISTLMEAARLAVQNPASSTRMVPITVRTRGDQIANWRHIAFGSAANNYPEAKLRDEAINRLAIGLDMPVEALTGSGGVNHWTGWLIDDQSWRIHVQPLAEMLVQNLTGAMFRPELANLGIADPTTYRINYDASSVVVNADRSKDAKDLHSSGAISDNALREANGFDEEDMPSVEYPNSNPRVILALGRAAGYGGPSEETGQPTPASPTPESPGAGPADVVALPPNEGKAPLAASADTPLPAWIEGAAMLAVERCRELAGAKIISHAAGDMRIRPQVEGVPKHLVACALGSDVALAVVGDRSPAELVAGGAATFQATLAGWGVPEACAAELAAAVEAHAAETLFVAQPSNLPPGLLDLLVVAA